MQCSLGPTWIYWNWNFHISIWGCCFWVWCLYWPVCQHLWVWLQNKCKTSHHVSLLISDVSHQDENINLFAKEVLLNLKLYRVCRLAEKRSPLSRTKKCSWNKMLKNTWKKKSVCYNIYFPLKIPLKFLKVFFSCKCEKDCIWSWNWHMTHETFGFSWKELVHLIYLLKKKRHITVLLCFGV